MKNNVLYMTGFIGWTEVRYITHNQDRLRALVLNSRGGKMAAGIEIANILRERGITTVVEDGSVCYSACTIIFQGGKNRLAGMNADFLYHAPYQLATNVSYTFTSWHTIRIHITVQKKFVPGIAKESFRIYTNFGLSQELVDNIPIDREGYIRDTAFNLYKYGDIGLVTEFLSQTLVWTGTGGKVLPARHDG